jgi:vanillate O-demethylase ferredoxin subunit
MSQYQVTVAKKNREADDIVSFELVQVNGAPLPSFTAGAHIDVHIGNGLIRQYSLCNAPHETHRYVIGVLRDPNSRGGSTTMHDKVAEGDVITISAPKNHFPLTPSTPSLLLAGGIGVTPILCMAEQLSKDSAGFDMHYCARSSGRTAFKDRIAASVFAPSVHYHFDDGDAQQKLDLTALLASKNKDTHIYVCGPGGFIDYVVNTAKDSGWPQTHIHLEYFAAAEIDVSGDGAFDVKIASSGQVIRIAADKTVVQALAEAGVEIQMSCEQGICGTCLTRVVDGIPEHRDLYLTDEEKEANDQFTPCCSRSKSPMLVLDIDV